MILKLNEEQVAKIKKWEEHIQNLYQDDVVKEMKAEMLDLLLGMPTLYKNDSKTETESFFYNSGLYAELKKAKNRYMRNERHNNKETTYEDMLKFVKSEVKRIKDTK